MDRDFSNKVRIEVDDFEDSVKISWIRVGGYIKPYDPHRVAPIGGVISNSDKGQDLIFSFENHDSKDYIVFYFFLSHYRLLKGDKVNFLFENNEKIFFQINEIPSKSRTSWDGLYTAKALISLEELKMFSELKLRKWKIDLISKKKFILSDAKHFYWYKGEKYFEVIKSLATEYTSIVNEKVKNHRSYLTRNSITDSTVKKGSCFLYLMLDTANNFYKIGISNSPEYRESTLQSEKPTIELIKAKEYPSRKIALSIESSLHKLFSKKRIRGEWFELDNIDVKELYKTLS